MHTSQFWLVYVMAVLSIFQGYYTLNVYKAYGFTMPELDDDFYLTKVGSVSALMGALRFLWSGTMDGLKSNAYKKVYGANLAIQAFCGFTIAFAA